MHNVEGGSFTTTLALIKNAVGNGKTSASGAGARSYGGAMDNSSGVAVPEGVPDSPYLRAISEFLGVPYVYGGNSKQEGLDCSSLMVVTFEKLGVSLPRTADNQALEGTSVPYDESCSNMQPGDMVFWNEQGTNEVGHVGMYVGNGYVVHAPHTGSYVQFAKIWNGDSQRVVAVKRV